MTETPKAPPTEQVFGIAKKMALELEKLPLHTHAGVINMMRVMVEHRKIELDNEMTEQQNEANRAAMAEARAAHAKAQVLREEHESKQPRVIVDSNTGGLIEQDHPKPELVTA
ncbi:MAG: hypothetical protein WB608_16225 [Terracidiphilus sp.]